MALSRQQHIDLHYTALHCSLYNILHIHINILYSCDKVALIHVGLEKPLIERALCLRQVTN